MTRVIIKVETLFVFIIEVIKDSKKEMDLKLNNKSIIILLLITRTKRI